MSKILIRQNQKKTIAIAPLVRRGKEGKGEEGYLKPLGLAHDSKTDVVATVAGVVEEAIRGTAMPRISVPRTAACHPT